MMQQTTWQAAIVPLLLVLTATTQVVNNTTVPLGDNYNTGYAQALNVSRICRAAGINVDHCLRYAMSQQYWAGWKAEYANGQGISDGGGEVNNANNNV